MNKAEKQAKKHRIADRKFIKDGADFLFRVVQMWIVLALVLYIQRATGSGMATLVMLALSAALLLYSYVTPVYLLEEWETARGRTGHALVYLAVLLSTVLVSFPLLFSDPIINEINRITHPAEASKVIQGPHG